MIMIARKFSLLRQFALAVTLAIGFGALWLMLVAWLGNSIQQAWQGKNRLVFERLEVRSDGTILIQSNPQDNLSEVSYRDLNGVVQDAPDRVVLNTPDRKDLLPAVYLFGTDERPGFFSPQPGWLERLTAFVNEREPAVNWYFVHNGKPNGAGYFTAYERTSNRRVGFIGMSGFHSGPVPAADWIPVQGEPKSSAPVSIYSRQTWVLRPGGGDVPPRLVYLPSGRHLRQADLAARTVTTVFEAPEPIESIGIPTLAYWSTGHSTTEQPILVRTKRQIHELDQQHRVKKVFSLPPDVDRRSSVDWYALKNGQAIAVVVSERSSDRLENIYRKLVYRIKGDGAIEDQFTVDLQTGVSDPDNSIEAFQLPLEVPVPAIVVAIAVLRVITSDPPLSFTAPVTAFLLKVAAPSLIAVLALSIVLAILVERRSRGFGLARREQITWLVFVLIFGLPAYVGFRIYRRWPIRQPCPNCHAQAPRDRVACAECGMPFPGPPLNGTEIFA
jgi:hypothetical protein